MSELSRLSSSSNESSLTLLSVPRAIRHVGDDLISKEDWFGGVGG